jgi:hypothetical protein
VLSYASGRLCLPIVITEQFVFEITDINIFNIYQTIQHAIAGILRHFTCGLRDTRLNFLRLLGPLESSQSLFRQRDSPRVQLAPYRGDGRRRVVAVDLLRGVSIADSAD